MALVDRFALDLVVKQNIYFFQLKDFIKKNECNIERFVNCPHISEGCFDFHKEIL